jgi:ATP-binding cassette, subfamily C, bacterial LapB
MFERMKKQQPSGLRLSAAAAMTGGIFNIAVASLFINILALAMPLALMRIFDYVIPERDAATMFWLAVGVASALILEALLKIGRTYVGDWMGARFEHLTGCGAVERLLGAAITDFDKRGAGAYLERLNALKPLRELYGARTIGAIADLPFALLFLGAIGYLAGTLVLVPIAVIALFCLAALTLGRLRSAIAEGMLANDRRYGFIIEVLGGVQTVKGLGMEEQMLRRYERLQETSADADYRLTLHHGRSLGLGAVLSQLAPIGVAGAGALNVIDGALSVGGLAAAILLAGRAAQPFEDMAGLWPRFQAAAIARKRLRQILDMPEDKPIGLQELPAIKGAIDFDGVSFNYGKGKDGEDLPPIFNNIDLHIKPGQTVGVIGRSASGKSTLLYLMMGVLTPTAGVARIDGYDLRECDPAHVRRHVAYLPQLAHMFNGTALQNITMFRDDHAQDARAMAGLLGLDDVFNQLPEGYETRIGDGAEDKLPRGTRQRIAIARALVDKPRVLLFDEANAFIDGPADARLLEVLMRLRGRVTLVMVTQRPSMLRLSDRIFEIRDAGLFEHKLPSQGAAHAPKQTGARTATPSHAAPGPQPA